MRKETNISLEELIPGISTRGLRRDDSFYLSEKVHSDCDIDIPIAPGLIHGIVPNPKNLRRHIYGQVLVDLGAGSVGHGRVLARRWGAKGYVAVEANNAKTLSDKFSRENGSLPYAIVQENMAAFLQRLPDCSVSILISGVYEHAFFEGEQARVEDELSRVTSETGGIITYCTPIVPCSEEFPIQETFKHGDATFYARRKLTFFERMKFW